VDVPTQTRSANELVGGEAFEMNLHTSYLCLYGLLQSHLWNAVMCVSWERLTARGAPVVNHKEALLRIAIGKQRVTWSTARESNELDAGPGARGPIK
jgi:hypothetical protein